MNSNITWAGNMKMVATSGSGHRVTLDGPESLGGENAGIRPMEMLLISMAGCMLIDVVSILKKSRQTPTQCQAKITAERVDDIPSVFSDIHIHFLIAGQTLDNKKVAKAISLSHDKYCSVSQMLKQSVNISHSFEIVLNASNN